MRTRRKQNITANMYNGNYSSKYTCILIFSVQKGIKIPVITIALKNDEVIKTLIVFRNLFQMLFYKSPNID